MAGLGPDQLRAIAFCADIAHAHEVQQRLVQHHLRAEVLTGRQHLSFRFDRKLRGVLGHTPKELGEFVATGFGRLDAGNSAQLMN